MTGMAAIPCCRDHPPPNTHTHTHIFYVMIVDVDFKISLKYH